MDLSAHQVLSLVRLPGSATPARCPPSILRFAPVAVNLLLGGAGPAGPLLVYTAAGPLLE